MPWVPMHGPCGRTCRDTWPCPGWPCAGTCSSACWPSCPGGRLSSWAQTLDASRCSQRGLPPRTGQLRLRCCGYCGRHQRKDFPRTWSGAPEPRDVRFWAAPACLTLWCAATRPCSKMAAPRPKPVTWRACWQSMRSTAATLHLETRNSTGCRSRRPAMHSPS